MRILGLDYGSKTVGVAVSDELLFTAQGLEIVRRQSPNKLRQSLARIEEIIKEYNVERIVLGYPKNMNNTEGERCEKTKEFKEMLERRTAVRCWTPWIADIWRNCWTVLLLPARRRKNRCFCGLEAKHGFTSRKKLPT